MIFFGIYLFSNFVQIAYIKTIYKYMYIYINNADNGIIYKYIYMNNIDNGFIQIGGGGVTIATCISSCLPAFPRKKRKQIQK